MNKSLHLLILLLFSCVANSSDNNYYEKFINDSYSVIDDMVLKGKDSEVLEHIAELKEDYRGLRSIVIFLKDNGEIQHFISVSFSGSQVPMPKIKYGDPNKININSTGNIVLVESPVNRRVLYRVSFVQ